MARDGERRLGELIDAIMREERMSVAQLSRTSGLNPNTIQYIRKGATKTPKRTTLRRIARGLATDPATLELDMTKLTRYERQVTMAAGYADPELADAPSLLELLLRYRLNSRSRAVAVAELVQRCERLDEPAIRRLIEQASQERSTTTVGGES
jgi:transcriptional regulator with XRE-family HTH domain